jgi:hypothetical protein
MIKIFRRKVFFQLFNGVFIYLQQFKFYILILEIIYDYSLIAIGSLKN